MVSWLPAYAKSKFPGSREEHWQLRFPSRISHWGTQRVIALCLYCVHFKILCVRVERDPIHQSIAQTAETGGFLTWEVNRKSGHFANAKHQAGAVFVDLTAAYDIVWYCGLTCKLLRFLRDRHMIWMIMELMSDRSFNRHPTGICLGTSSFQHLHLWLASYPLQKVCICRRSSNHACWWKLASNGRSAQERHGDYSRIPPDS